MYLRTKQHRWSIPSNKNPIVGSLGSCKQNHDLKSSTLLSVGLGEKKTNRDRFKQIHEIWLTISTDTILTALDFDDAIPTCWKYQRTSHCAKARAENTI